MYPLLKVNEIKKYLSDKESKNIMTNFMQYGVFQAISYLVPLITVPYLVRNIGIEKFGILSFALAIIYYFQIIVEYGFSITGVQMTAQSENSVEKQSEIITNVLIIQLILLGICFLILIGLCLCIGKIHQYTSVYFIYYGHVFSSILFFTWFYIGIEKMRYLNEINSVAKVLYVILIILFIKKESDYLLVPVFYTGTSLVAGIFSVFLLRKKFRITFHKSNKALLRKYIYEGWHIFISNVAINLYRNTNVIILGVVSSEFNVGIYSAGEKIVKALQAIFTPLTQTLFPYLSRQRVFNPKQSINSLKKIIKVMAFLSGVITISVVVAAKPIARIFVGDGFESVKRVIQIGSPVVLFGVLNYIIGIIFMTNFGLKRQFSQAVIMTGLINVIVCFLLSKTWDVIGTAVALSFSEVMLCILLLYYVRSNRAKWAIGK